MKTSLVIFSPIFWIIFTQLGIQNCSCGSLPCSLRKHSDGTFVCVCNSSYCDTLSVNLPANGNVTVLTSSKDGTIFKEDIRSIKDLVREANSQHMSGNSGGYQTLKGFGGALTDAAALNIMSLSEKTRERLFDSYFSSDGIEYNVVRIPMGSCDYSTRFYTYLDKPNDFNLSSFALAAEDTKLRIPMLKRIFTTSTKKISLFASPWTVPLWMKTNHNVTGIGHLIGVAGDKYHKTWAKYFVKFFDEYKAHDIQFWGVTLQNEPSNGALVSADWQSTGWWPSEQRDFIKSDLGPMLKDSGYGDLKLMIHDDQRSLLPKWPDIVLSDPEAAQYVSGTAVHWYWDYLFGPEVLNATHNLFPSKFILSTEACNYDTPDKSLGSWELGEKYSNDILDNLNNWAIGWIDWNMCLDLEGGPNWKKNYDNSPIIVNASADEFYKQPMYYHLGHFSKVIPEGSVLLHSTASGDLVIKHTAVLRPDGYYVVVILNKEDEDVDIKITIGHGSVVTLITSVPKRSIQTYIWKGKSDQNYK